MGSGADGGGDAAGEDAIHVALGRDLKKGKAILDWVFRNLGTTEVVIVHVHKPPKLIPMKMGGKFPVHMAAPEEAEIYIEAKRAKMNALLQSYMRLCSRHKISVKTLVIETEDVYRGIAYIVGRHQIKRLVMGLRSIKDQPVLEEGLLSCQIWLIHNGKLVSSRQALVQQISIEFTGDENQGNSTSLPKGAPLSPKSAPLSPKSAKERSSTSSANERSSSSSVNERSSTSSTKETSSTSSVKETSSPKIARETSSHKSAKEISSPKSAKETCDSHESHQDYGAPGTSGSWSMEQTVDHCPKVEEIEVGSSNENFEAEDFRDLLVKLVEAVHVVYQQRLDLARQMLMLKQEFIEFSLPELEEATKRLITKKQE